MLTGLSGYDTPGEIFHVYRVYFFVVAVSYFVLIFDWISNLRNEYIMVIKPKAGSEGNRYLSLKPIFLLSKYLTLFWCTFVIASWASASNTYDVCNWFRHFPYIYSIVALPAHILMILRVHSIYGRSTKVLGVLLGLALADFIIQMATDHLATSVLLANTNPNFAICFTYPTSKVFCLVFLSPTILHHILLGMTLWKSAKQLATSKSVGVTPILHVIQRDHILYTLAICLINFTNFVLVLQPGAWPYKLIMQFPALVFTQILLSRTVFSLKKTQISTLAGTSLLHSSSEKASPASSSPATSGQQEKSMEKSTGSEETAVQSRKMSMDRRENQTSARSQSMRKASSSISQTRRPSADDASIAPTFQSHRRGSSATLAPSPHPTGDYKFAAYSMSPRAGEDIPPVPVQATPAPPPLAATALPVRYHNYRMAHRTMPGGRFRRQTQVSDIESVDTSLQDDEDESHMSEAGDRVLDIRSSFTQPPAVYPYLFEPPGTANSSLPPPTGNSERANRSSGEFDMPDDYLARMAQNSVAAPGSTSPTHQVPSKAQRPTSAESAVDP
ncbi:hypothetical protein P389DRAFT_207580 [Cystobasidium minutum MCA 4210]|uniref:uncharacterized protein n=1 Tax=Cystobasidium minutum MCA 4210 TaxID=1397322 RepID=UPI0034CE56F7|eukprot:jgi/Rhomi1/207580/estExt_Genemark1.C_1_t20008